MLPFKQIMKTFKSKQLTRFAVVLLFVLWIITLLSYQDIFRRRVLQNESDTRINLALPPTKVNTTKVRPNTLSKDEPVSHLGLLKVHKAASTTTQAIFLRFGWRRNLTFVLPQEYNIFGFPNIISTFESVTYRNILPPPSGKTFDILCHHVIYQKELWEAVLPADSVLVGTLREPFEHFKSSLNYFNPKCMQNIHSNNPVETFLKQPMLFESNIKTSYLNNRQAFEYGVDFKVILGRNFEEFDKYLKTVLDKVFAVVIIAERFDESLIILRRRLKWQLDDIIYLDKNVRNDTKPDRYNIKDNLQPLHQNYSKFDYLLYDYFDKKLNSQIRAEGKSFWEELRHFKYVQQYIETFCVSTPPFIQSIRVAGSRWNDAFDISREDCSLLRMGEITFTQLIRKRQYGKATWKMSLKKVKRKAHL